MCCYATAAGARSSIHPEAEPGDPLPGYRGRLGGRPRLGRGSTWRELELVADALRSDAEACGTVCAAADSMTAWKALADDAEAAGSSGFVALDLMVELGRRR
jgi:hypothetical protein